MAVITPPYQLPDLRPFRQLQHRPRLVGGGVVTQNGTLESEDFLTTVRGWAINGAGDAEFNDVIVRGTIAGDIASGDFLIVDGGIESADYVAGVSGWHIDGSGTVEFNDGTFRGTIDASALNITISELDDGSIEFYSSAGLLVGRLAAGAWEIGDLTTPGLRATLDPIGGLRFRSESDQLQSLLDQQGLSLRDPTTGLVLAELNREYIRLVDVAGGNEVSFSTFSSASLFKPRYTAAYEANPSSSLVVPAATLLGTNDLELGHVASWLRNTAQTATHTSPAGWTEQTDTKVGSESSLGISVFRRSVATGTTGTATSSRSNWQHGVGTHIIVKGTVGGTTPSVRSVSEQNVVTTGTTANVSISKPTGAVAGDMLVVFIAMGNNGGTIPVGWSTPDGWVFLGASLGTTGTGASQSTLAVGTWAYLMDGTEGSTFDTDINFGAGTKTIQATMVCVQNPETIPGGPQMNIGGFNLAGAWRSYTPSLTNITLGNGTITGGYLLMGKTCFVRIAFVFGSTSAVAAGARIGLPFAGISLGTSVEQTLAGSCVDISAVTSQLLAGRITSSSSNVIPIHDELGASFGELSATAPFTWATGDSLNLSGVYEIP